MFQALSNVLLPVMIVAGLGALLASRMQIDQVTVSRITMYLLIPALVLDVILQTPVKAAEAGQLGLAFLLTMGLSLALGWLIGWGRPDAERRSLSAAAGIWNSGNMGLPIALFAFGDRGFDQATVVFLVSIVAMYIVGPAIYGSASKSGQKYGVAGILKSVFRLPTVWVALVALGLRLLNVPLPEGITRGVSLLAQATLPLVLLSLGLQLGAGGWPPLNRRVWLASAARLIGGPLIALGVGSLVGLRELPLAVLILSASMPTAVNALLLAQEYGGDSETVAGVVLVTTLGSVLTVAAVVALLPGLG
ncbi:AEC family transporter [Deinococcus arenicola]|uniref:AEC family transporter n=1 Tax=Deinococcus arenicola TaxID=2994950 RepID=A0ABU4DMS3_9DEIO|nr:AEC family transporter [Deinococcus sp. ZS9-10]MDV6373252.1 AEC family transporter [Deinococcus sp. ZS9-10]